MQINNHRLDFSEWHAVKVAVAHINDSREISPTISVNSMLSSLKMIFTVARHFRSRAASSLRDRECTYPALAHPTPETASLTDTRAKFTRSAAECQHCQGQGHTDQVTTGDSLPSLEFRTQFMLP